MKNIGLILKMMKFWVQKKNPFFEIFMKGRKVLDIGCGEGNLLRKDREKIKGYLKEGGIFAGLVPNAFSLKNRIRYLFAKKENTPLGDPTHINHFSCEELGDMLQKYFNEVEIIGLGRFKLFSRLMPSWFAFSLFFKAK